MLKCSEKGLVEIAGHEGICLSPYLDSVGVWTIGVGATKSEIPNLNSAHTAITVPQAIDLFKKSIVKYENGVNKALKVSVTQEQFDALVSICYNIGVGGLSGSTFIKMINNNSPMTKIVDAIMMWTKPKEITARRRKEAKLYSTGQYSNNGKALVFPVNSTHRPVYSKGLSVDIASLLRI